MLQPPTHVGMSAATINWSILGICKGCGSPNGQMAQESTSVIVKVCVWGLRCWTRPHPICVTLVTFNVPMDGSLTLINMASLTVLAKICDSYTQYWSCPHWRSDLGYWHGHRWKREHWNVSSAFPQRFLQIHQYMPHHTLLYHTLTCQSLHFSAWCCLCPWWQAVHSWWCPPLKSACIPSFLQILLSL